MITYVSLLSVLVTCLLLGIPICVQYNGCSRVSLHTYVCVPNVDYSRFQRLGIHGVHSSIVDEGAPVEKKILTRLRANLFQFDTIGLIWGLYIFGVE